VQTGTKFRKSLGEPFGESYDLAVSPALSGFDFYFQTAPLPHLHTHSFSFPSIFISPSPSGRAGRTLSALNKINLCFQKETGAGRRFITKSSVAFFFLFFINYMARRKRKDGRLSFRVNERAYHNCDITVGIISKCSVVKIEMKIEVHL